MFNNIFNKLRNLLVGRNGVDALSVALMVAGAVITFLLSIFTRTGYWRLLGYIPYIIAFLRIFSINTEKRQKENAAFIRYITPWKNFAEKKLRQKQDVDHRYYNCPGCGRTLRVPRNKGKIKISCPHCNREFTKRT